MDKINIFKFIFLKNVASNNFVTTTAILKMYGITCSC